MTDALASDRGNTRQTQSYLRGLLEANGLQPRRQWGQCFLVDLNILELVARGVQLGPRDVVLEVGAGTGSLTTRLAAQAGWVVAVEIDPGMYRLAGHTTSACNNVTLLHGDALADKYHMSETVIAAVNDALRRFEAQEYYLVANLPYNVATLVIGNLLLHELPIRSMVVTVQQEMGDRIVASAGSKDYGPISALVQRIGRAEWLRTLRPEVFWPRPKVTSAILRIDVEPDRVARLPELIPWYRFVRELFMHRRKTLRSAIASIPGYKELKPRLDDCLVSLNLPRESRAEELGPEQLQQLFTSVQALRNHDP